MSVRSRVDCSRSLLTVLAAVLVGCGGSGPESGTPGEGLAGTGGGVGAGGHTSGSGGSSGSGVLAGAAGSGFAGAGFAGAGAASGAAGASTSGASGSAGAAGNGFGGGSTSGGAAGTVGSAGATASAGAGGSGTSDPCGPGNPATVPLPVIPSASFKVTDYGAVGDNKTNDTTLIQAALNAAGSAGGGTVVVPAGTFLSGPLVLTSNTRLELSSGAVLKMLPMASYGPATAFITANQVHDIALTGAGTIDGQGQAWWTEFASNSALARPQEVSFSNSTRVLISGVRFQNSPEEHIWVKGDTNLTITGIKISTLAVSGQAPPKNTDGVDMTANGAFFCNNDIACGDDNLVTAGSNIYVAYSAFGVGHGCTIGSITSKGVSSVIVDHLTFDATTTGIRMKSARDRGGVVKDLSYTNITMKNVPNPVFIASYYPSLPTDPKADTAQAVTATTPYWQNITIKNLTATGSTNGGIVWGLPEAKVQGLVFDNVKIQAKTGMQVFHATGISFVNGSSVTPSSGAAVTTYDAAVTGATTTAY